MSKELQILQKELWKTFQVIKSINTIAEKRELKEEEKERLKFLITQMRSIQQELKEEKAKLDKKKEE